MAAHNFPEEVRPSKISDFHRKCTESEHADRKNNTWSLPSNILFPNINKTDSEIFTNNNFKEIDDDNNKATSSELDINSNNKSDDIVNPVPKDLISNNNNNNDDEKSPTRLLSKTANCKKALLTIFFPKRPLSLPARTNSINTKEIIAPSSKRETKEINKNVNKKQYEEVKARPSSSFNNLVRSNSLTVSDNFCNSSIKKCDDNLREATSKEISQDSTSEKVINTNRRKSYHQDVEEALNSLLWQPYEYQVKQNRSVSNSTSSSSSCTSCSSLSMIDLEEYQNNGTVVKCGNIADLHLTKAAEMVNNLSTSGNRLNQWKEGVRSRDVQTTRNASRLSAADVSFIECAACVVSDEEVRNCISINCNECTFNYGDMRLEVPSIASNARVDNILTITSNNDGLIGTTTTTINSSNNVAVPVHQNEVSNNNRTGLQPTLLEQGTTYQRSISSNNLSSANVVGLPNHPRHASVPSSTSQSRNQTGNGVIFPNHPRNTSEPSTMSQQQFRYSSNQAVPNINCANIVSVLNHQRHSSHTDANNMQIINHLRSSSVPKTMVLQKQQGESIGTTLNVTPTHGNTRVGQVNESLHRLQQQNNRPPLNVSNVNVNFYRAVPVNVVSSVPTIQCVNTSNDLGNNVSNVHIMPLSTTAAAPPSNNGTQTSTTFPAFTTTQVTVHNSQAPTQNNNNNNSSNTQVQVPAQNTQRSTQVPEVRTRTFTSTEAQTDDIAVCSSSVVPYDGSAAREQRRRERRERRHQRRVNNGTHRHNNNTVDHGMQWNGTTNDQRLPDILNSHLPPPYSPLPSNAQQPPPPPPNPIVTNSLVPNHMVPPPGTIVQPMVPNNIVPSALVGNAIVPFPPQVVPGQVPLVQGGAPVAVSVPPPSGFRFPFPASGFRRARYSEEPPKSCCGLLAWKPGSLRWFIVLIALVGVCCVLVGTALGAMRPAGRDHLTVSLLMIGVGIILVTVSGVAWRLTSHDSSTCRSLWGLGGSTESVDVCGAGSGGTRRFVPRLPPSYGRPHHPYAAMMYPEFQYRPPPPSYQASMQEYRLRLLLLDRGNTPQIQAAAAGLQNAVSPPPTYRSHAGSLLRAPLSSRRDASQSEYSCPPSYRSQTSSTRPATLQSNMHSREQSISLSESNHGGSVVNVVSILNSADEDIALDNLTIDSLKMEPESEINPLKMSLKGSSSDLDGSKDGNLVTIVQTSDQSPVIVTVSGSSNTHSGNHVQITEIPSEMEILAHL